MEGHPDVAAEQRYVDDSYECLERMRAYAAELLERKQVADTVDDEILRWHLQERVSSLADSAAPLVFGRIDQQHEDPLYVGRRHVRDPEGEVKVVDWRARAAAPFYRATIRDPMDVHRRRRFAMEGRELLDLFDEYLDDPDSVVETSHGGVPDPLLAEIGRARTGQMRDIVSTIQAEQDEIIRSPIEELVLVQGGPGTGKTAVGLHRTAFLLYEHRATLERERVLIVGPNRLFLAYISNVLPSLGETAVYQTTVLGLAAGMQKV
ncbi:MAG: AAA family ATPase, partial [Actinomycetota bacterium]|nr:AAA family ATPase [Actinomycetota bacterium]